jgi:hypothetical protein
LGLGKLEVAEKGLRAEKSVQSHATRVLKNLVDQGYTDPMYFNLIKKLTPPQFKIAIADLRRKIYYTRQKKFSRRTWRVIVGLGETNMRNILSLMKLYRKNLTNSEQHAVYFGPDHWDTLKKIGSHLIQKVIDLLSHKKKSSLPTLDQVQIQRLVSIGQSEIDLAIGFLEKMQKTGYEQSISPGVKNWQKKGFKTLEKLGRRNLELINQDILNAMMKMKKYSKLGRKQMETIYKFASNGLAKVKRQSQNKFDKNLNSQFNQDMGKTNIARSVNSALSPIEKKAEDTLKGLGDINMKS